MKPLLLLEGVDEPVVEAVLAATSELDMLRTESRGEYQESVISAELGM